MKTWKLSFLFLISLIIFSSDQNLSACGGDWGTTDDYIYTFFDPEITGEHSEFFLTDAEEIPGDPNDYSDLNITEWKTYFGEKDSTGKRDWDYLIYQSSAEQVDSLLNPKAPDLKIPENLSGFAKFGKRKKMEAALRYLIFAKSIEKIVASDYYWWYEEKPQIDTISKIREAQELFKKEKDDFLKERYGFQLQRLYYKGNFPKQAIAFYKDTLSKIPHSPSIVERSYGYLSASYYKDQNFIEADLMYAKDFAESQSQSAFWSFRILNDAEWETLLSRSSTKEKEAVWFILGYGKDPLRAMQEIYKLNPQSSFIEILLTRAINAEEHHIIDLNKENAGNENYYGIGSIYSSIEFDSLLTGKPLYNWVEKVIKDGKAEKKAFWETAAAHLAYLKNDLKDAEHWIKKAKKDNPSEKQQDQIHLTSLLVLYKQTKLDAPGEKKLAEELPWLINKAGTGYYDEGRNEKVKHAISYIFQKLAKDYVKAGKPLMAELCIRQTANRFDPATNFYQNDAFANQMLELMRKPKKTEWETLLLGGYSIKEPDIIDWQTIQFVYKNDLQGALKKAGEQGSENNSQLYGNPYIIHAVDCHDCDHIASEKNPTKVQVIEEMIRLTSAIEKGTNIPDNAYKLGNAYYNISTFGNARKMYLSRIAYDLGFTDNGGDSEAAPLNIYNTEFAKKYYSLAYKTETRTERKAELCWLLSKCELNDYFNGDVPTPISMMRMEEVNFILGPHAGEFNRKYRNTKYYKEVIRDCGYFRTFVKR